ncbi:hypothetical protein [Acidisoma cellulosilyticum]|uniref:hypothetical protein n=1 Tax=Acidisoma cellulosilyticum TaxID=2802395 RepID=UPI001D0B9477|nr:hypothetical protein [Acidisoma cellulosilyticum]
MSLPFIICSAVTVISALISLGYSVAAVMTTTNQARVMALYTCARSTALFLISVYALLNGSAQWLQATATGMIVVQALDAAIGVTIKDTGKTFGPAGVAIANLAALVWFMLGAQSTGFASTLTNLW